MSIIDGVAITSMPPPAPFYSPMFLAALLVIVFMIASGYAFFARRES